MTHKTHWKWYIYGYSFMVKGTTQEQPTNRHTQSKVWGIPDVELLCPLPIESGWVTHPGTSMCSPTRKLFKLWVFTVWNFLLHHWSWQSSVSRPPPSSEVRDWAWKLSNSLIMCLVFLEWPTNLSLKLNIHYGSSD